MRKEKRFREKKFKTDLVFSAYNLYLEKSGISEKDSFTRYTFTKDNLTTDCDSSTEFFAKIADAEGFVLAIRDKHKNLRIYNDGNYSIIEVELPSESDIDEIINSIEGIEKQQAVKVEKTVEKTIEKTIEKHSRPNKKYLALGIGIPAGIALIFFILENFVDLSQIKP